MPSIIRAISVVIVIVFSAMILGACSAGMSQPKSDRKIEVQQYDSDLFKMKSSDQFVGMAEDESLFHMLEQQESTPVDVLLYFYNPDKNKLEPEKRTIFNSKTDQLVERIIKQYLQGPKVEGLESVIPLEVKVEKVEQYGNVVSLHMSKEFLGSKDLSIARAALVNTILELQGVDYVKIYVADRELTHNGKEDGKVLGLLTEYPTDIEQIKAQEAKLISQDVKYIKREIYFQDEEGRYLIPEIRDIPVYQDNYVEAIVGELIKGPARKNEGLYPVLPNGTQLMNVKFVGDPDSGEGVELYFSKEFKLSFDKDKNFENMIVGSLVYSLMGLPDVEWIKIYYQNKDGEYVDSPLVSMNLNRKFNQNNLICKIGRRIKIYFGDKEAMNLVPEYRAISRDSRDVENEILNELIEGPLHKEHTAVIPQDISVGDIDVYVKGQTAFVNLPSKFNASGLGSTGEIMALYAIVNSLTDPVNTENIKMVQFLVDGKLTAEFGHMSLADPFVRNPGLIKE